MSTDRKRWFLDEKLQFETTAVKAMYFWSLNTRFYLTMENRWFLAEKLQFETTDVNARYFWSLKTRFLPYDGKPMVSWWENPIWNTGWKSNVLLVLNARFYLTMENRWFLDEKLQFETTDVKAMYFWSWTLVFTSLWKTDGFLMRNYNLKQRM